MATSSSARIHTRPTRYIAASRGSLISQIVAIRTAARTWNAEIILLCIFVCTALNPLGATVVGYALNLQNITRYNMQSQHTTSIGTGLNFSQGVEGTPPLPGAVTNALTQIPVWANNLTKEPLPEYRDYLVDRNDLDRVGNISAYVVKMEKSTQCSPFTFREMEYEKVRYFRTAAKFPREDSQVRLRIQPRLTAWVDRVIEDNTKNISISTVIFASLNGTIEGGAKTEVTHMKNMTRYTNGISAISCNITIGLKDSLLTIGQIKISTKPAMISTVSSLAAQFIITRLTTWLGCATTVMGINIYGAQPMWVHGQNGLKLWTTNSAKIWNESSNESWKLSEIEEFINVSAGAVAMGFVGFDPNAPKVQVFSQHESLQLDYQRSYLLLIPVATILGLTLVLAWRNAALHRQLGVPAMRLATIGDILRSSQTTDIREATNLDAMNSSRVSKLGDMKVRYGVCPGNVVGLGSPADVSRFNGYTG